MYFIFLFTVGEDTNCGGSTPTVEEAHELAIKILQPQNNYKRKARLPLNKKTITVTHIKKTAPHSLIIITFAGC